MTRTIDAPGVNAVHAGGVHADPWWDAYSAPAWMRDAACGADNAGVFFPEDLSGDAAMAATMAARAACAACPVREQCLSWACGIEETSGAMPGIYGGLTTSERKKVRKAARPGPKGSRTPEVPRAPRRNLLGLPDRPCDHCAAPYTPQRRDQRFCSQTCRYASAAESKRLGRERVCGHCGTRLPDGTPSLYCGLQCRNTAKRDRERARMRQVRAERKASGVSHAACRTCGAPVPGDARRNQRYCGDDCRALARKRQKAAHRARKRERKAGAA